MHRLTVWCAVQVIQGDELKALQRFPGLQSKILATIDASLDEYRRKSREFVVHLVKMEGALVIPQLFKVAEEQFSQDKRDMGGADAEYGKVWAPLPGPHLFSVIAYIRFWLRVLPMHAS